MLGCDLIVAQTSGFAERECSLDDMKCVSSRQVVDRIKDVDFKQDEGVATVYFEKPSAVTTALMLDGGTFEGGNILSVKAEQQHPDEDHKEVHDEDVPISQSDKPRSGSGWFFCSVAGLCSYLLKVAAELLAKGYTLSDQVLHRAIALDRTSSNFFYSSLCRYQNFFAEEKGISQRFLSYFQSLDTTIGEKALGPDQTISGKVQATLTSATERARAVDEQKGFSKSMHEVSSHLLQDKDIFIPIDL